MTAPATQSNNAAGKRSLPSAFFTPLQTLGRYMERHSGDSQPDEAKAPFDSPDRVGLAPGVENGAQEAGNEVSSRRGPASGLTIATGTGSEGGQAAFSDVALRVWGARREQETELVEIASSAFDEGTGGTGGVTSGGTLDPRPSNDAPVAVSSFIQLNAMSNTAMELRRDPEAPSRPTASSRFRPGLKSGPNEVQALAHDANNLLSALRLYGELLCFSGVLHERHRHYAEDLKLLSLRSEKIIDRLLRLADEVAASNYAAATRETLAAALPALFIAETDGDGIGLERREIDEFSGEEICRSDLRRTSHQSDRFLDAPDLQLAARQTFHDGLEASARTISNDVRDAGGFDEPTSLPAVLKRIKGLLGTLAHGALEVDLGSGPGRVPEEMFLAAPVESLERILVNLVANAAAAIRGGGAVRIRAALLNLPEGGAENETASEDGSVTTSQHATPTVVLTVDDSGCGMSEAQVRVALGLASAEQGQTGNTFVSLGAGEPGPAEKGGGEQQGQEADQANTPTCQSHGLGLSIVRELVASTGGRLLIHSRPGTGTRIEMRWKPAQSVRETSRLVADWPVERYATGTAQGLFGLGARSRVQPVTGVRAEAGFEAGSARRMGQAFHETDSSEGAGLTAGGSKQHREARLTAAAQGAVA